MPADMLPRMRVGVLGAVQAWTDGGDPLDLGTRKQRAIVAALALAGGQPLPVDRIVDLLWGDEPPPGVATTLQTYIAGLRKVIEPDRAPRAPAEVLVTVGSAYALRLAAGATDVEDFEARLASARALLGELVSAPVTALPSASDPARVAEARARLTEALALWRGTPYDELGEYAEAERVRLEEERVTALELVAVCDLAAGDAGGAATRLESLTGRYPLRERLWALRALALTRSGRQADALAALREVRTLLDEELGIDPSPQLRDLETRILQQDPALVAAPAPLGVAVPSARPRGAAVRADGWPMVGRDGALAELVDLLDAADTGEPQFAAVVGEPGIGKSRLCRELSRAAVERDALVLVGRCSQDDGAPPLWPWASVLDPLPGAPVLLGTSPPAGVSADEAGFALRETVRRTLAEAATDRTLLVILDDLHWADSASLYLLAHLAQNADSARLLVLSTWRSHPEPAGALAVVADTLARRHATRIDLAGLGAGDAARLVEVVTGSAPEPQLVGALCRRTDGNPFFLVEYARLAGTAPEGLAAASPPRAVSDVLARRLAALPGPCLDLVRPAAVLGRQFDLAALRALVGLPEEEVLDGLEPAVRAGLVEEHGIDRFRFSHALVRDAAYESVALSRRARLHARAAEYAEASGLVSDAARHWLESGPAHAARAWRSAVDAAGLARVVFAHEEAAELMLAAVRAHEDDPGGSWVDRYDMLMLLLDDRRQAADWTGLTRGMIAALRLAQAHGDVERSALAAEAGYTGALWQPRTHAEHLPVVIDALRSALRDLPPEDGDLRCRVMLSLAVELYYTSGPAEREALSEQALAMARRLGDDGLLLRALFAGTLAVWRPSTAELRLRYLDEAVDLARRSGDEAAIANTLTLQACCRGELGLVRESVEHTDEVLAIGRRRRLRYVVLVMCGYLAPLAAMAGRHDEAAALLGEMSGLLDSASLPQSVEAVGGAGVSVGIWRGDGDLASRQMSALAGSSLIPTGPAVGVFLARAGRTDEALAWLHEVDLGDPPDDWSAQVLWPILAEAAVLLGDHALAARTYEHLAPWAGRMAMAGTGSAIGPVDAYLAMAAARTGATQVAVQHLDDAERLCAEWGVPLCGKWVRSLHSRLGLDVP